MNMVTLPKKIVGITPEMVRVLGIKLGDEIDDIHVEAELPDGWWIHGTDHPCYFEMRDESGHKRADIYDCPCTRASLKRDAEMCVYVTY